VSVSRGESRPASSAEAIGFTAGLLVVVLVLLASTFDLPASSALVPRAVGIPLAALLGYRLLREIGARSTHRDVEDGPRSTPRSAEVGAIVWFLALPALSTIFGFAAGPALFVFLWARYRAGERLVTAAAAGLSTAAIILILFTRVLRAPLWQGLLEGLSSWL